MSNVVIAEPESFVAPVAAKTRADHSVSSRVFALGLTASYFLLGLINVLHHSLWRDEMQVWMAAQKSHSLLELLHLKYYEDIGHPDGWHALVYPVSRLTSNPFGLQLLHIVLATITAYVIARYSPFPRLQKALIVFGYFLFYEYAIVSHDYALGILPIFLFCAAYRPGPRKNYALLASLLAITAEANIYAVMVALAFGFMMLLEIVLSSEPRAYLESAWRIALGALLFAGITLAGIARMIAPADSGFVRPWHFPTDPASFGRTIAMMWKVFVPIPQFTHQFWNSNIVPVPLIPVLSILVLAVTTLFFIRKPLILSAYASGLFALFFFRHAKYAGFLRNDGHAIILFLACMWLAYSYPEQRFPVPSLDKIGRWFAPYQRPVFVSSLVIQVAVAAIASAIAFRVPFSQAKNTAEFLRSQNMDRMFIVGDPDAPLLTLAGYLQRDIYYLRGDRMGSYVLWNGKRLENPKLTAMQAGAAKAAELNQDVLVIVTRPVQIPNASVTEVASFTGSIVGSEDYYVYLVRHGRGI
jgi:hypothetical protein